MSLTIEPMIEPSWKAELAEALVQPSFLQLQQFLVEQKQQGKILYPAGNQFFSAFDLCPFDHTKVVMVGQDPYHGAGQAHGLCFSVTMGVKPPPSLVNIYKELQADLGIDIPEHGCLEPWAKQGVLLLNSALSVEAGKPASHAGKGWEPFTDAVIRHLSEKRSGLVFILWGRFAQKKAAGVDRSKHLVLEAAHPSPFSVRNFSGCRHFSKANEYLQTQDKTPIDWSL